MRGRREVPRSTDDVERDVAGLLNRIDLAFPGTRRLDWLEVEFDTPGQTSNRSGDVIA